MHGLFKSLLQPYEVSLLFPLYRWRKWGSERLSHLCYTYHHWSAAKPQSERLRLLLPHCIGTIFFVARATIHTFIKAKPVLADNEIIGQFSGKIKRKIFIKKVSPFLMLTELRPPGSETQSLPCRFLPRQCCPTHEGGTKANGLTSVPTDLYGLPRGFRISTWEVGQEYGVIML